MPIYEYECSKCGKTIEVIQKFSDKPLKKHKECGGNLNKLISAAGFQFKGSGWYVTDYGKNGSKSGKTDDAQPTGSEAKTTAPKENGSSATPSSSSATSSTGTTKESAAAS